MYSPLWAPAFLPRCLGHHKHLDDGLCHGRRSEELREALVAALDKKTLWNEYGIVSSIIVRTGARPRRHHTHVRALPSHTQMTYHALTYTSFSPATCFTRSSSPSRITSSIGSTTGLSWNMAKLGPM